MFLGMFRKIGVIITNKQKKSIHLKIFEIFQTSGEDHHLFFFHEFIFKRFL